MLAKNYPMEIISRKFVKKNNRVAESEVKIEYH